MTYKILSIALFLFSCTSYAKDWFDVHQFFHHQPSSKLILVDDTVTTTCSAITGGMQVTVDLQSSKVRQNPFQLANETTILLPEEYDCPSFAFSLQATVYKNKVYAFLSSETLNESLQNDIIKLELANDGTLNATQHIKNKPVFPVLLSDISPSQVNQAFLDFARKVYGPHILIRTKLPLTIQDPELQAKIETIDDPRVIEIRSSKIHQFLVLDPENHKVISVLATL